MVPICRHRAITFTVGVRYNAGLGHELLGRRMLDVGFSRGRLYELMHNGRALVLDQTGRLSIADWAGRVDHVVDESSELDVPAMLLRPHDHVAWVGEDQQDLRVLLSKWFGEASSCQDFAQKGQGVTCLCEQAVGKGTPKGQTEERTNLMKSDQGGFLCDTITHMTEGEPRTRVGMPVCACWGSIFVVTVFSSHWKRR